MPFNTARQHLDVVAPLQHAHDPACRVRIGHTLRNPQQRFKIFFFQTERADGIESVRVEAGADHHQLWLNVIRERFRLKGQVRAASAHGRLTATVLVLMPILLMFALLVVAPGYLQSMADDPDGKWMIVGAIIAQLVGFYFIRRIINIKV